MKPHNIKLLSVMVFAIYLVTGCSKPAETGVVADKPAEARTAAAGTYYDDAGLGIREETLFIEAGVEPPESSFPTAAPGSTEVIERAFSSAPPQIPHSTEGLLPIKTDNNACTGCHMPSVAAALNATAVPESHLEGGDLDNARFNCSQCHVTQANVEAIVENTF